MAVGIRLGGGFLQVVPMLDDLSVFETENVEAHLRAEEVVFGMGKHEIAVMKNPHRIDPGCSLGQGLQDSADPSQAGAYSQVVLNVLVVIDIGERLAVTRLYALEKFDD